MGPSFAATKVRSKVERPNYNVASIVLFEDGREWRDRRKVVGGCGTQVGMSGGPTIAVVGGSAWQRQGGVLPGNGVWIHLLDVLLDTAVASDKYGNARRRSVAGASSPKSDRNLKADVTEKREGESIILGEARICRDVIV